MAKAYGSLTVVDLLDTATYIYYATDGNGSDAAISPANKQYIGIYSGPPLGKGQPAPGSSEYNKIKSQITWSKYHGEKGDKGDTGNGIQVTEVDYAISNSQNNPPKESSKWSPSTQPIPTTTLEDPYLWTRTTITYSELDSTGKNKKSISYSVSSTFDSIEVGSRNLLLNSKAERQSGKSLLANYTLVPSIQDGEKVTFSAMISPNSTVKELLVCDSEDKVLSKIALSGSSRQKVSTTFDLDLSEVESSLWIGSGHELKIKQSPSLEGEHYTQYKYIVNANKSYAEDQIEIIQDIDPKLSISLLNGVHPFLRWPTANLTISNKNLLGPRCVQHIIGNDNIESSMDLSGKISYKGIAKKANPTFNTAILKTFTKEASDELQVHFRHLSGLQQIKRVFFNYSENKIYIAVEFNCAANAEINETIELFLTRKDEANANYESHSGKLRSIKLSSAVYGGRINWTKGSIEVYEKYQFTGEENWKQQRVNGQTGFLLEKWARPTKSSSVGKIWNNCNLSTSSFEKMGGGQISIDQYGDIVVIPKTPKSLPEFKRYMTKYTIVYAGHDSTFLYFPAVNFDLSQGRTFYSDSGKIELSGATQNIQLTSINFAKLERGNFATDWTPAPEDVSTDIENSSYYIDTNHEELTKFFKKGNPTNPYYSVSSLIFYIKNKNSEDLVVDSSLKIKINYGSTDLFTKDNDDGTCSLGGFSIEPAEDKYPGEGFFICRVLKEGKVVAVKTVPCRYGTNQDMAKFAINASDITASIQEAKVSFSRDGLDVYNASFRLYRNDKNSTIKEPILDIDPFTKNFTFSGDIHADNGYFKGDIEGSNITGAKIQGSVIEGITGKLGGFTLDSDRLVSSGLTPSLVLDGKNGKIIASDIELRNNAKIAGQVNAGSIKIGSDSDYILIEGKQGSVTSMGGGKSNWKLSSNEAYFKNVSISGELETCTLKKGEVQAVGGILIVRPSSILEKVEGGWGYLKDATGFEAGGRCRIKQGSTDFQFTLSSDFSVSNKKFRIPSGKEVAEGAVVIYLGKTGDIGIGINSSQEGTFMTSEAISVNTLDADGNYNPRIILGQLPDNKEEYGAFADSYGLYAENVLLKGSLVTKRATTENSENVNYYSGVSTLYDAGSAPTSANTFRNNWGEIVFWAGALGDDKKQIENSPFFIDTKGNMYCNSGRFKGSVITDATIEASSLKTTTIIGTGDKPALVIRAAETGKAISFYDNDTGDEYISFSKRKIAMNGIGSIVLNENAIIDDKGVMSAPELIAGTNLKLTSNKIINEKQTINFGSNSEKITFEKNGIETFGINEIGVKSQVPFSVESSIFYKGEKGEYRPIIDAAGQVVGYDLYIKE